ncbi:MAG: methyltransferase family protein [Paracoccaceae bacterium]
MQKLWRNVIDMPPVWLLVFMALVWVQTRVFNPGGLDLPIVRAVGWLVVALGIFLMGFSIAMFRRHKTSVIPRNRPDHMITTGPFRFSRNPIYLADALVLLGFALLMGSAPGILSVAAFMALIEFRFIRGEEAVLRDTRPEAFANYCKQTRRWF